MNFRNQPLKLGRTTLNRIKNACNKSKSRDVKLECTHNEFQDDFAHALPPFNALSAVAIAQSCLVLKKFCVVYYFTLMKPLLSINAARKLRTQTAFRDTKT